MTWLIAAIFLIIFSYGFIDPNLSSSQNILTRFVYETPLYAASVYVVFISVLFFLYKKSLQYTFKKIPGWFYALISLLLLAYSAFSYDIFNYILTAKVTFLYRENPYIVMPIEIPNEPMLAFTRAANKVALYGPTWIILTSFPFLLSHWNIFFSIVSFKAFVALFYIAMMYLIFRKTKRLDQVMFFALNPLVLIEILVSGHNDIVMMVLGVAGLLLWQRQNLKYKTIGLLLFISSVFVKGATIALLPIFFLDTWEWNKRMMLGFFLMMGVFLLSPLREEMYPWYAIWWISFAAFIPIQKRSYIHDLSFWFSFGLMFRYVPWIATREYLGITPVMRNMLTFAPVFFYLIQRFRKKIV